MTSLFDVDFHDEGLRRREARRSVVAARAQVEAQFGDWFRTAETNEELAHRVAYAEDQLTALVPDEATRFSIIQSYAIQDEEAEHRTAAVHESRKPKLCPFHRDVVDISLAQGEAKAGFEALRDHWGGARHCQGDGYEGDKCNFKPAMATQSYWDERAEKAEQRKRDRAERAEQEQVEQQETETVEDPVAEVEPVADVPADDNVVDVDFGGNEAEAPEVAEIPEVPMSMAASKEATETTGLGGPESPIQKRKWAPGTGNDLTDVDSKDGPNPTRRKDVIQPIVVDNTSEGLPKEIGEATTERVDLPSSDNAGFTPGGQKGEGGSFGGGGRSAVSSADDVDKNPLVELIESDYDGFVPQSVVQSAIAKYRS